MLFVAVDMNLQFPGLNATSHLMPSELGKEAAGSETGQADQGMKAGRLRASWCLQSKLQTPARMSCGHM